MSNNTNHLIKEKSPYLLQHAHNPVDWYPWADAAFEKAREEDKPVLLSIGYSTCHWCHVMAHESFEDEGIAKIINEHFIAIKVDREERPDIDHIYMTATTAMTGQGGWPLTVFLTPQAEPFYGGTYFPPYAKWGSVGFGDLLNSITHAWRTDRENILTSSRSITESLRFRERHQNDGVSPREDSLHLAFRQMRGQFDPANGGLGIAPKFPMGHNLSFLLRYHLRYSSPEALGMVEKTLTAMSRGGIYDHLGGGFHRYSTDQIWHVPHFEKMLYDQALLVRAYLEGYQATGSLEYASIAAETLDYVLREMTDPLGGFYSAQDADSLDAVSGHLKEGAFYVFSQAEVQAALGDEIAVVFNYCYGVKPQGNASHDPHGEFCGRNILYNAHTVKEAAREFHKQENEIADLLQQGRSALLSLRNLRSRPHKDDKVLCDWNGLMMSSLAFAGRVLGEGEYTRAAARSADFILERMMVKGRLMHRWREGSCGITATLDDYAFFTHGLLEVYEASSQDKYLDAAVRLADTMVELFADPSGGFFMTAGDAAPLIMRPKEAYDGAVPSGNSVAVLVMLKLYSMTGKEIYLDKAQELLNFFAHPVDQTPYAHCFLLMSLDWHLHGVLEITFRGGPGDEKIAKMLEILYKSFIPSKVVKFVPASGTGEVILCFRGACQTPINSVEIFEKAIRTGL